MPRPVSLPVLALTAAALLPLAPTPASADYLASNSFVVQDRGEGRFHIPWQGDSWILQFWCAAGDYVIGPLQMSPTTRIWRASPVKRGRGGVDFSLSEADSVGSTGLLGTKDDGSLSAAHAQAMCLQGELRPF